MNGRQPSSFVFISYARKDVVVANRLQRHLEADGFSTWKDNRLMGGTRFDDVIEQQVRQSTCVLTLWSKTSVASKYVKDESALALETGKLIPVAIEDCEVSMRFRFLHTHDLKDWSGLLPGPDYDRLKTDLAVHSAAGPIKPGADALHRRARMLALVSTWGANYGPPVAATLALVLAGVALFQTIIHLKEPVREPDPRPLQIPASMTSQQLLLVGRLYEIRSATGSMKFRIQEVQWKSGIARVTVSDVGGISQDLTLLLDESKPVHLSSGTYSITLDGVADNGALFSIGVR